MSLNVKNEETQRLVRELALLTGETMTGAITVALRERLEREKRLRRMRAISKRVAKLARRPRPVRRRTRRLPVRRAGPALVIVDPAAAGFVRLPHVTAQVVSRNRVECFCLRQPMRRVL